jgi:hypothetical protein
MASAPDPAASSCVVCYAAPADVLLPVCGHVILCTACWTALRAREAPACPVCRAPLAQLSLPPPPPLAVVAARGDGACYVLPKPRLAALLYRLRRGRRADADNELACVLEALAAFAAHSEEQQCIALAGGALHAVCDTLCAAPLSARVLAGGCEALARICSKKTDEIALCDLLLARDCTRARNAALHVLRCFAHADARGGDATRHDTLCRAALAVHKLLHARPSRRWLRRHAPALVRLLCTLREAHGAGDAVAKSALRLLRSLALLRGARDVAAPAAAAQAAAALAADSNGDGALLAIDVLHSLLHPPSATAHHSSICTAAHAAGAVPALLAALAHMTACVCAPCARCCGELVLPSLAALCEHDPAVLAAAVRAGLMPLLAHASEEYVSQPFLQRALCDLLARCLPPLGRPGDVHPSDEGSAPWREARRAAADAAVAAELPARVVLVAQIAATATSLDDSAGDADTHQQHALRMLDVSLHALGALNGMLQHAGAPLPAASAAAAAECVRYVAAAAHAVQAAPGSDVCETRSLAMLIVCRVSTLLLRTLPATGAFAKWASESAAAGTLTTLSDCPCITCDAAQAAACALLRALCRACYDSEALERVVQRNVPALLSACAEHPLKPQLRREAPRTLALLLATCAAQQGEDALNRAALAGSNAGPHHSCLAPASLEAAGRKRSKLVQVTALCGFAWLVVRAALRK